ncbi:hypothetical protein [Treponema sp.]|uniref:hypothetical protein n=1 Tax=Treponema sp. TaxID=166 RepID=UPI00388D43AC
MKMKRTALLLTIALSEFLFASCTEKQIAFDVHQWKSGKNRYYMTDSLVKKLETEQPTRAKILDLLGTPELSGGTQETELSYFLKSDEILFGLAMSEFCVRFNADGTFLSAQVIHSD